MKTKTKTKKAKVTAVKRKVSTEKKSWDSTMIKSTVYNFDEKEFTVKFRTGGEYLYKDFSSRKYSNFLKAESKGQYFLSKIKPDYNESQNFEKL